eukprot:2229938-Rhodomonas_salina.2
MHTPVRERYLLCTAQQLSPRPFAHCCPNDHPGSTLNHGLVRAGSVSKCMRDRVRARARERER